MTDETVVIQLLSWFSLLRNDYCLACHQHCSGGTLISERVILVSGFLSSIRKIRVRSSSLISGLNRKTQHDETASKHCDQSHPTKHHSYITAFTADNLTQNQQKSHAVHFSLSSHAENDRTRQIGFL